MGDRLFVIEMRKDLPHGRRAGPSPTTGRGTGEGTTPPLPPRGGHGGRPLVAHELPLLYYCVLVLHEYKAAVE